MRLPLTILLGALIIGGVVGVVGISMQPRYDDSRLQPISVQTPSGSTTAAVPAAPVQSPIPPPPVPTPITSTRTDVPAPPPATFDPIETTDDDGGHHRGRGGDDDEGDDDGGHGGGDDDRGGSNSGPG
jgi:hypothetical protein